MPRAPQGPAASARKANLELRISHMYLERKISEDVAPSAFAASQAMHKVNCHMSESLDDSELICRYRDHADNNAFEALVRRHYASVLARFIKRTGSRDDAEDLSQLLWIRVVENIDSYDDSGRFPQYLSTIATNLLKDHWRKRGVRGAVDVDWPDDEDRGADQDIRFAASKDSVDDTLVTQEAIDHMVSVLIPGLPCEQRTIYLLRHESEHWEEKQRLEWTHLAQLNGVDVDTAWKRFESARHKLLTNSPDAVRDSEEGCVFMVWTQAQRPSKHYKYTDQDLSALLGVDVNTLKTRYRTAKRQLADGLRTWRREQ